MSREFPSLDENIFEGTPHGWVQWKGTDVCCDLHCACGAHLHYDGWFMYYVKCSKCGQVYECGGYIKLYPVDFEPENVKVVDE